jgi:Flp pilus assembly secretin CpaC
MRYFSRVMMGLAPMLLFAGLAAAQQKPAQEASRIVPLKVQIVVSEYDGTKKISSLPYTLDVNAVTNRDAEWTHLRLGVRLPIRTGAGQMQYTDVGTNIDCSAQALADGTYKLNLTTERSSVSLSGAAKEVEGLQVANSQPIIRNFRVSNTPILRDGQSDESTIATDPVSGHLMRISVTLHVVKSSS